MRRWSCDRRGLQFAVRGQHLFDGTERFAAELGSYSASTGDIRIDHSHQAHSFALLLEFLINSSVIAPEDAHTHNGDEDRSLRCQEKNSVAGCRKEIVNGFAGKST